jgi:hypothetical protein
MHPRSIHIADLLLADGTVATIDEQESLSIDVTLTDDDGVAIDPSNCDTITLTVYEQSSLIIASSSLNGLDILDANNGTITGNTLRIRLDTTDNAIKVSTLSAGEYEWHVEKVAFTYTDGAAVSRKGIHQQRFRVRKIESPTTA